MKWNMFLMVLLSIGFFSQAGAVMQPKSTYETFEAFQSSGDAPICKVVSDGCNEWYFQNGEKADPIKLCKLTADFEYSWSCTQYNEGIMTILGNTAEESTLDMMYTDSLTAQERQNYDQLQENISETQMTRIQTVVERYLEKRATYTQKQQELYFKKVQALIQKHIDARIKQDDIYLMLQFVKLEIKIVSQSFPIGPLTPLSGELYSCSEKEYRVYDADYFIDDMGFVVEKDTIHVSDGTFLLPNFIATQSISASGVKYTGKNTETQESYTFWFKADEMSVYKGDALVDTCVKK